MHFTDHYCQGRQSELSRGYHRGRIANRCEKRARPKPQCMRPQKVPKIGKWRTGLDLMTQRQQQTCAIAKEPRNLQFRLPDADGPSIATALLSIWVNRRSDKGGIFRRIIRFCVSGQLERRTAISLAVKPVSALQRLVPKLCM